MATMSDSRQGSMEITARFSFSLADAIVLEHRLGRTKAAKIFFLVDPWCYPGEETPASAGIKLVLPPVAPPAAPPAAPPTAPPAAPPAAPPGTPWPRNQPRTWQRPLRLAKVR